ncbi:MAG: phosphoglycerate dehydrogenase, partial [Acidobacteria bacterium]|nr:phosphoglycerate dehydrogenase [Acidobacteriota bacterium]
MIKVLLVDTLSQKALELLGEIPEFEVDIKTGLPPERLKTEIGDYEAIVTRNTPIGKEILHEAGNLKIIVKAGIDFDNIDIEFARSRNIEARNTPFATATT